MGVTKRTKRSTVEIWKEGGMFTVYCPELDIASCGPTAEKAKKIKEVIEIQLEERATLGTLKDFFGRGRLCHRG